MSSYTQLVLETPAETDLFGRHLGSIACPGDIFTLSGELGSGKTTLTQSIGKGLNVPTDYFITSPTFSLLHEYPGRIPLFHMDLYRLNSPEEIIELGFEDYMYGDGLTVIEWPDRLQDLIPEHRLDINLIISGEKSRLALLNAYGEMESRLISLLP